VRRGWWSDKGSALALGALRHTASRRRLRAGRCVKFPPIKKPAIRGGLRKARMKQDVQEKPHLDRFIKTAVKIKEAGYGRQM